MSEPLAPHHPEEAAWRAGLHSARATALPGFVLVCAAVGVVVSYYNVPAVHALLEKLAAFRVRGGFYYSAVSTALFAGIVPFFYLRASPTTRAHHPWPHLIFFALFWGYKGIEVDLLYRLQAGLFGTDISVVTLAKKLTFDQIVYNGMFAAPYGVFVYAWKDAGFRWSGPLADFRRPRWYARRVLPVMIAVMGVWIPAVLCIYSMPLALQLPLNSLINCFWVILFSLIMVRQAQGKTH
jgi:hypothetical protein